MKYQFHNDLGAVLAELEGRYDLSDQEAEELARTKLSPTRLTPVHDLRRALRIERGEEEPNLDDPGDQQLYGPRRT